MTSLQMRLPDAAVTAPHGEVAWGKAAVVSAGFCLFWVAFVIILTLLWKHHPPEESGDPLCRTDDCIQHAAFFFNITAKEGDPCFDFYEYVCSAWSPPRITLSHFVSAMDAAIYGWFKGLKGKLRDGLFKLPIARKPLNMYESCSGDDSKYGTNPGDFLSFLNETGLSWPHTPPADVQALDLFISVGFNYEVPSWFSLAIAESPGQTGWRLVVSPDRYLPHLLFHHEEVLKSGAYVQYWKKLSRSVTVGAFPREDDEKLINETAAMEDDVLRTLHAALADPLKQSALFPLGEIGSYTPAISSAVWLKALQKNLPLRPTMATEVLLTDITYMRAVGNLFRKYGDQNLVRHISWLFAQMYGPVANSVALVDHFGDADAARVARPLYCGSNVEVPYKILLSALYFVTSVSNYDKALIDDTFDSLLAEAVKKVTNCKWLDSESKQLGAAKIHAVRKRLWPEEIGLKMAHLAKMYRDFPENETSFAAYWVKSRRNIRKVKEEALHLRLFDQPKNSAEPYLSYDAIFNSVLIAIGALVRPLYYRNGTMGMLYGGIGFLMTLEIVKSLDRSGLRWHPNGSAVNSLLSEASAQKYAIRDSCTRGGNNRSVFPEIPALEIAYAAFQRALRKDGRRWRIADDLTEEKVFFLTLCFMTCPRRYVKSPTRTDCNKAVRNFPEFAKAFSCDPGSRMNPYVKCEFFN
ncbi:endothelin-converting enzyme 1-like [Amblyomma americanum]